MRLRYWEKEGEKHPDSDAVLSKLKNKLQENDATFLLENSKELFEVYVVLFDSLSGITTKDEIFEVLKNIKTNYSKIYEQSRKAAADYETALFTLNFDEYSQCSTSEKKAKIITKISDVEREREFEPLIKLWNFSVELVRELKKGKAHRRNIDALCEGLASIPKEYASKVIRKIYSFVKDNIHNIAPTDLNEVTEYCTSEIKKIPGSSDKFFMKLNEYLGEKRKKMMDRKNSKYLDIFV